MHSAACCLEYLKSMGTEALSGVKGQVPLFPGGCSVGIQPGPAGLGCSGSAWCCREAAAGLSSGSCRVPLSSGLGEMRALRPERQLRGPSWGSKSCWWAVSRREWELCGLRNVPLAVVPVALGSWRCVGNCQV